MLFQIIIIQWARSERHIETPSAIDSAVFPAPRHAYEKMLGLSTQCRVSAVALAFNHLIFS